MEIKELKVTVGEVCEGYFNDAVKNEFISFNISHLDEQAVCELKNFYNSLCKENSKKP